MADFAQNRQGQQGSLTEKITEDSGKGVRI